MALESKRKRSTNYSKEESWNLLNLVLQRIDVIETKKTDSSAWTDKKNAWEAIAVEYNKMTLIPRTADQLRSKYETLKKDTRRMIAKERSMLLKMNDSYTPRWDPLLLKIKEIIEYNCIVTNNYYDEDINKYDEEEVSGESAGHCDDKQNSFGSSSSGLVNIEIKPDTDNFSVSSSPEPMNTNLNGNTSTPLTITVDKTNKINSEIGLCSTQNKKTFEDYWLSSKKEVLDLKLKIIQDEHDKKMLREHELHQAKLAIMKEEHRLQKRKLELEIEILQKQLK